MKTIHVGIGEIHQAQAPDILTTILGSCVGIGIHLPKIHTMLMAHVLLPEEGPNPDRQHPPGRHATTAIPALVQLIRSLKQDPQHCHATLAGGANMFDIGLNTALAIGPANTARVLKSLEQHRIQVLRNYCGGTQGIRMTAWAANGVIQVEPIR